jgi:hypothetical protein
MKLRAAMVPEIGEYKNQKRGKAIPIDGGIGVDRPSVLNSSY